MINFTDFFDLDEQILHTEQRLKLLKDAKKKHKKYRQLPVEEHNNMYRMEEHNYVNNNDVSGFKSRWIDERDLIRF